MTVVKLIDDVNQVLDEMIKLLEENKIEEFTALVDKFKYLSLGLFDAKKLTKSETELLAGVLQKIDMLSANVEHKKSTINDEFSLIRKTNLANSTYTKYSPE